MKTEYRQNLKTNQFGELDINYYVAKGRHLRSESVREILQSLIAKLRSGRAKARHLPLNVNFRH
jgi:hypothetical protein